MTSLSTSRISVPEVGGSLSGSAILAPTDFNVSTSTSTNCGERERVTVDLESGTNSFTSGLQCPLCGKRRRPFTCSSCVNAGNFLHSSVLTERKHNQDNIKLRESNCAILLNQIGSSYENQKERLEDLKQRRLKLIKEVQVLFQNKLKPQEKNTRLHLQEEKLLLLRKAVSQGKTENQELLKQVDDVKDQVSLMQIRKRKHDEKHSRIKKFVGHFTSRQETKTKDLDEIKTQLKKLRRKRIEDLMTHIFTIHEERGPVLPSSVTTSETNSFDRSVLPPAANKLEIQTNEQKLITTVHVPLNSYVSPLLLEINKDYRSHAFPQTITKDASRLGVGDEEESPAVLPVYDESSEVNPVTRITTEDYDDEMDEDDDDLIISHLEKSLMQTEEEKDAVSGRLEEARKTSYVGGRWVYTQDSFSSSLFRIIHPTLPVTGDFSKILPLIAVSRKASIVTVPDPSSGKLMTVDGEKSTAKRLAGDSHRIEEDPLQNAYAALALTAQLVNSLSFYLDVIVPKKVGPADFMIKPPKVSSFVKSVNKLNANILFLCFSQFVPLTVLHPSQMMHNIQMLLNTTVTPHLGSVFSFRVDEALMESLEESVVIVGDEQCGASATPVVDVDDLSSSSSSSDEEDTRDEIRSSEWENIPADMNIPSLPMNEGFAGGESSSVTAGLSSYSGAQFMSSAAASVASWWSRR